MTGASSGTAAGYSSRGSAYSTCSSKGYSRGSISYSPNAKGAGYSTNTYGNLGNYARTAQQQYNSRGYSCQTRGGSSQPPGGNRSQPLYQDKVSQLMGKYNPEPGINPLKQIKENSDNKAKKGKAAQELDHVCPKCGGFSLFGLKCLSCY